MKIALSIGRDEAGSQWPGCRGRGHDDLFAPPKEGEEFLYLIVFSLFMHTAAGNH
jgi:hypothetical protein